MESRCHSLLPVTNPFPSARRAAFGQIMEPGDVFETVLAKSYFGAAVLSYSAGLNTRLLGAVLGGAWFTPGRSSAVDERTTALLTCFHHCIVREM